MKRIFPVLLAVMIFCASLAMAVPARADFVNGHYHGWYRFNPSIIDDNGLIDGKFDPSSLNIDFSQFSGQIYAYMSTVGLDDLSPFYVLPTGVFIDDFSGVSLPWGDSVGCFVATGGLISPFLLPSISTVPCYYIYLDLYVGDASLVDIAEFAKFMLCYEELPGNPFVEETSSANTIGVYPAIYDILADAFYGDGAELSGDQTLVLTVLSTFAVVLMVALPFLLVWLFVRMFTRF